MPARREIFYWSFRRSLGGGGGGDKLTGTLGWVHVAEDIHFVERRQRDEEQIPDHQDDAQSLVQLPAVQVRGQDQEDNGGEE